MSEYEELRREARLEVKRVQVEARERWGHIECLNLDTPSYYQDILTRLADALESLNRENKELSAGITTEWGTEVRDAAGLIDRDVWENEADARTSARTYGEQLIRRTVGPWEPVLDEQ